MNKWLELFLALFTKSAIPKADDSVPFPLSPDEMRECVIASGCSPASASVWSVEFTKAFIRLGVQNSLPIAHILAHSAHESKNFLFVREDMYYRSVKRIRDVFGKNRGIAAMTDEEVARLVGNPEALANVVYDDANRDAKHKLGNIQLGDGWFFRGWGPAQLTGRAVMEAFAQFVGMPVSAVMARTDPEMFALSAVWFAIIYKRGFVEAALEDGLVRTTAIWQGGGGGLAERKVKLDAIKAAMRIS